MSILPSICYYLGFRLFGAPGSTRHVWEMRMVYSRITDWSNRSYPAVESDYRISRSCGHVWVVLGRVRDGASLEPVCKANWGDLVVFILKGICSGEPFLHCIAWILFYPILRQDIAIPDCKSLAFPFLPFNPHLLLRDDAFPQWYIWSGLTHPKELNRDDASSDPTSEADYHPKALVTYPDEFHKKLHRE